VDGVEQVEEPEQQEPGALASWLHGASDEAQEDLRPFSIWRWQPGLAVAMNSAPVARRWPSLRSWSQREVSGCVML